MNHHYEIIQREEAYRGFAKIDRFHVRFEYYQGGMSPVVMRECNLGRGSVAALAYDPKEEVFVFVEQFRIGALVAGENPWHLEIVAGLMDKEGEPPENCIAREIEEELGTPAQKLTLLHHYLGSPGGSGGRVSIYLAEIDSTKTKAYTGLIEEGEDIRVVKIPAAELPKRFASGDLNNAMAIIAIQAYYLLKHPIPT
ncbi:MAG: NUDIX domain-containing protein [Cardiobacteriaceae bacterium]|nr:NUDIX domain-containing protein [Cardiobacteriaceae bacterium]